MKNQEAKKINLYVAAISVAMKRKNGTPAQLSALQASILRGKELVK